jgi:ELWxxDGT repeat protein
MAVCTRVRAATLLLLAVTASDGTARAQVSLLRDINTEPVIYSSSPRQMITAGDRVYFLADTPEGEGLWRTDGSSRGTVPIELLTVGRGMAAVQGTLFFVAWEPATGAELWRSDGTTAGTALVRDIVPGPGSAFDLSARTGMVALGSSLLFVAHDGVRGPEPWISDGTAAGTRLVADLRAGPAGSRPDWLVQNGASVLFAADDGVHGRELWSSDGTAGGSVMLADIAAGEESSDPLGLTAVDGVVFFRATDETNGAELWRSDGTAGGTSLVRNIDPGQRGSFPGDLTAVGGALFFTTAHDNSFLRELWTSDGTAEGTVPVLQPAPISVTNIGGLFDFSGTLVFLHDDGVHGYEPWRSDCSTAGTGLIRDIAPGPTSSRVGPPVAVGGLLFFFADDGTNGREPWRSDGTRDGTVLVRDVMPGPSSSTPAFLDSLAALGGRALFGADDGVHGRELWVSDGSAAGTHLLRDLRPGPATADSDPANLTPFGGGLLFAADDGRTGVEPWRTDGSAEGTVRVRDINPGAAPSLAGPFTVFGNRVIFSADDGVAGAEPWTSDGTAAGTALLADVHPGSAASSPEPFVRSGNALFFAADDGEHGRELWQTDGSADGTYQVRDIAPGETGSTPEALTDVDGTLFFTAAVDGRRSLWRSDGTEVGTVRLVIVDATQLTDVSGTLYFTVFTTLWKSDGTPQGTVPLGDFHPVSGQYTPNQLTATGGRLFFAAEADAVVELWTTDGSRAEALRPLDKFQPAQLTAVQDRLFFTAEDPEHGLELWTTDGTVAGTHLVRDVNPGPAGSFPSALTPAGERLLFRACDQAACRLWESDGTEAGTRPLADLGDLGPATPFAVLGSRAYFSAFDERFGMELRSVSLSGQPPCLGDCNGDGAVTIDELTRLVRAALALPFATHCAGAPAQPQVDDLITAVNHALTGCR